MTNWLSDVRFAARTLFRTPWFTALTIATVGLGIGGATSLFSLVNAVLLRQLPFDDPQQLVEIWGRDDRRAGMRVPGEVLEALRTRSQTLDAVSTHDPTRGVLQTSDGAVDVPGETVSANFIDVYGVRPTIGRGFAPEEERPGSPAVMLVTTAFWRQYLDGDAHAVGRIVYFGAVPHTVIGVMPPEFRTRFVGGEPQFWTVHAGNISRVRERELGYEIVARVAPDRTVADARREVIAIASALQPKEWRESGRRIDLVPLKQEVVGDRARALILLMAGVGIVLAVACANLAQLLLARSDHRLTEFATRKAIGATSGQLFRLALIESLLLAVVGGAAGVVLAYWLVPAMRALAPSQIPRLAEASLDLRVMFTAIAISVLTGCAFGAAPAWRLSRLPVLQVSKPAFGAPSRGRARFRSALVVVQVAAAVTLLALAGLVVRTFLTLSPSSPGFATGSRSAFVWVVFENDYPDVADRRRRIDDLLEHLETTPGIAAAAVASSMPFGDDEPRSFAVRSPTDDRPVGSDTLRADVRAVSANFLSVLEIPVLEGRPLAGTDRADASRVALVNQTLARRLASAGPVVGRSIRVGNNTAAPLYEIVGVVADTRWWGTTLTPLNEVYVPMAQDRAVYGFVIVRSGLDSSSLTRAIKTAFSLNLPGTPIPAARRAVPLDEMIAQSIAGPRFNATLVGSFSAVTMALAVIGLFGLVAYSVSQRRQELGIRSALGAEPRELILMSMRSAMLMTATGVALGIATGTYLTRFIASQLYAVDRFDPATFGGAAIVMLASAAAAAYWPARRAVVDDPVKALRYQ